MSADETLADVLAEMRKEWSDFFANHVDLRDVGYARTYVGQRANQYFDRIEAAWKRDELKWARCNGELGRMIDIEHSAPVGDAVAMREVMTALAAVILPPRDKAGKDRWLDWVRAMQEKARAALAAPARNCVENPNGGKA